MTKLGKHPWLVLLASFLLICGGISVRPVMRYRALCRLRDHDWSVETRDATPRWLPDWMRRWSGDSWVSVGVLRGPPSDDNGVAQHFSDLGDCLAWLPGIQSIDLYGLPNADHAVSALQSCRNLKRLELRSSRLTDRGVETIATLASLESLDLSGNPISDEGLRKLAACPRLTHLDLSHSYMDQSDSLISGAGFDTWSDSKLEVLRLSKAHVSDASIKELRRFRTLRILELSGTRISDRAVDTLMTFPNLEELHLDDTQITNASVQKLTEVRSLGYLLLSATRIDDIAIGYLSDHPKLHTLSVRCTKVTDRCVADLIRMPHLFYLDIGGTNLTPAGFSELAQCRNLEHLDATNTAINAEAIESLLNAPQLEEIRLTRRQMADPTIAELAVRGRGAEVLQVDPFDDESPDVDAQ